MDEIDIEGLILTPLKKIQHPKGDILHAMKKQDIGFSGFGEAYFSLIDIDAIKAWKRHLRMTLNIMVPLGAVQFVFFNDQGVMREEVIGLDRYVRLTIPPGIWFGFRGLVAPYSLLMNIADIPHDPAEIERKELGAFKFQWEPKRRKHLSSPVALARVFQSTQKLYQNQWSASADGRFFGTSCALTRILATRIFMWPWAIRRR